MLIDHYKFPISVTEELDLGSKITAYSREPWLKRLQHEGMIQYTYHGNFGVSQIISVSLTEKGKPYVIGQLKKRGWPNEGQAFANVKLGEKVIQEITGIRHSQDKREATIDYTWAYNNLTPFAKGWQGGFLFTESLTEGQTHSATAVAVLYDDGWRIAR